MSFHSSIKLIYIFSLMLICSCGGGGGKGPKTEPVSKSVQTFAFADTETQHLVVGDIHLNRAIGQGTGKISYASSAPEIISVDNDGMVSVVGMGEATITATIAEDDKYKAASTQYVIKVSSDLVGFTAWVGESNTEFLFSGLSEGNVLTQAFSCDDVDTFNCPTIQHQLGAEKKLTDANTNFNQDGFFFLNANGRQAKQKVSVNSKIPQQIISNIVVFKGEMYVVTSQVTVWPRVVKTSIYTSSDGFYWKLKTELLVPREKTALVVYQNQLWLIGGTGTISALNDVWVSSDGINWTEKAQVNPFTARYNHQLIVFQDQLLVVGGHDQKVQDIWSSTDGSNWTLKSQLSFTTWDSRLPCTVFKEKLWCVQKNEVRSSDEGVNWSLETSNGPLADELLVFQDKLWVFAKRTFSVSADGVNWITQDTEELESEEPKAVNFDNKIWLIGGKRYFGYPELRWYEHIAHQIWNSDNGVNWRELNVDADFIWPNLFAIKSINNNLMLFNREFDHKKLHQHVWVSRNGLNWTKYLNPKMNHMFRNVRMNGEGYWLNHKNQTWFVKNTFGPAIYKTENGFDWDIQILLYDMLNSRIFSFKDKLYRVGGSNNDGTLRSGVFSSVDGKDWTKETEAPFLSRLNPIVQILSNKIILFGGKTDDGNEAPTLKDVWISEDGVEWTDYRGNFASISADTDLGQEQIVVFQNKLWFLSEQVIATDTYKNELWRSDDGVNWVLDRSLSVPGSQEVNLVVHDGKLWIIGGLQPTDRIWNGDREIWNTEDGIVWRKGFRGVFELK